MKTTINIRIQSFKISYLIVGIGDEHKEKCLEPESTAVEQFPHISCGHDVVPTQVVG